MPSPLQLPTPKCKFGFELEFTGPRSAATLIDHVAPTLDPIRIKYAIRHTTNLDQWAAHDEIGLQPNYDMLGLEIKSRINPEADEIAHVLNRVREFGAQLTPYCGMHVHVSHPILAVRANLPKTEIWPERLCEAANKKDLSYYRRGKGVDQINNKHLEIRVFNSTLNTDRVLANLSLALACVSFHQTNTPENEWESVPVSFPCEK